MQQVERPDSKPRAIFTVASFADRHHTFLTQPALRSQLLNAEPRINSRGEKVSGNGLAEAGAIIRLGRRILIDEERYFAWLAQQQRRAA